MNQTESKSKIKWFVHRESKSFCHFWFTSVNRKFANQNESIRFEPCCRQCRPTPEHDGEKPFLKVFKCEMTNTIWKYQFFEENSDLIIYKLEMITDSIFSSFLADHVWVPWAELFCFWPILVTNNFRLLWWRSWAKCSRPGFQSSGRPRTDRRIGSEGKRPAQGIYSSKFDGQLAY